MYLADAGGRLVLANMAYRRISGASASAPLLAPDVVNQVLVERRTIEHAHRVSEGNAVRTFTAVHAPIMDEGGTIVAVGGHYRETTETLAAQRRIETLSGRVEDLNRLLSDWVWEVDAEFRFTLVSPRAIEAVGRPPRALIGASLFEVGTFPAHGDHPTAASRSPFHGQVYRTVDLEGVARHSRLSAVPVFDGQGEFAGYRGVGTDITAQLAAETRAANAQMRLIEAIESISEGFALFDEDDKLVLCNGRFRDLFAACHELVRPGVRFESLMRGAAPYAGLAEDERARALDGRLARHRDPGEAIEERFGDRWVLVNEQPTRDGGIVSTYTDISDLKERARALELAETTEREARQAAEAANQAKSSFLANVSHELRTPLNAIIGFSEIIKNELYGPIGVPQYLEYVRDIHDSGRHLLNLINDILDFSKAEAGKLTLYDAEVALPAVIARCRRFVEETALRGGVTLVDDVPRGVPGLWADERKVKQMLLNLMSNAVKFTPGGGTVTMRVRLAADGSLVVTIEDTGHGMSEAEVPLALSPFVQLEDAMTRRHQGTGLGLPLTKSLIELHGGSLSLTSRVGVGTTVSLIFPAERVLHHRNTVSVPVASTRTC